MSHFVIVFCLLTPYNNASQVGGKDFLTLRSTVNSNPVLADHVARAEQNREKTSSGAVFIDREPTHFQFILNYLRNRVERLDDVKQSNTISPIDMNTWKRFTKTHIHLPKDDQALRELYLEAAYYRIPELKAALTEKNLIANIFRLFSGNNPFDSANQMMARLRTFLLTITTISATGATVAIQRDLDSFLKFIGWRDKNAPSPADPAPATPAG